MVLKNGFEDIVLEEAMDEIITQIKKSGVIDLVDQMTPRERQIAFLGAIKGMSISEMSKETGTTQANIKFYNRAAMTRVGASSRYELAMILVLWSER